MGALSMTLYRIAGALGFPVPVHVLWDFYMLAGATCHAQADSGR